MDWLKNEIYRTVDIIISKVIPTLKFNYTLDGKITQIVLSDLYEVSINEELFQIKSMNGMTYQVGDIVRVIVFNNNTSDKQILCKR